MPRTRIQILRCQLAGVSCVLGAFFRPVRRKDLPVPEFSLQATDAPPAFLLLAEFEDDETSWEEFDNFTEASEAFEALGDHDEDALRVRVRSCHGHRLDWVRPGFPMRCPREGDRFLLLAEEADGTRMFEFHDDWTRAQDVALELQQSGVRFIEVRRGGEPTLCWTASTHAFPEPQLHS